MFSTKRKFSVTKINLACRNLLDFYCVIKKRMRREVFHHKIFDYFNALVRIVDLKVKYKKRFCEEDITDLTRCPMPMMSLCCLRISVTNSIGSSPVSNALLNCLAAWSNAPPKRSPLMAKGDKISWIALSLPLEVQREAYRPQLMQLDVSCFLA